MKTLLRLTCLVGCLALGSEVDAADWVTLPSGSIFKDVTVGNGVEASGSAVVTVSVSAWLHDPQGRDFKGRALPPARTETRPLTDPAANQISGVPVASVSTGIPDDIWQLLAQAVVGMKAGGKRTVVLPATMPDPRVIEIEVLRVVPGNAGRLAATPTQTLSTVPASPQPTAVAAPEAIGEWRGTGNYSGGLRAQWQVSVSLAPTGGTITYDGAGCPQTLRWVASNASSHVYQLQEVPSAPTRQGCYTRGGELGLTIDGESMTLGGRLNGSSVSGRLARLSTAQLQQARLAEPAWKQWNSMLLPTGNTVRFSDRLVGSGAALTPSSAGLFTLASFPYNPSSLDFKGTAREPVRVDAIDQGTFTSVPFAMLAGMTAGGTRLFVETTPSPVYGDTPIGVIEARLVKVAGRRAELADEAARMARNGGKTDDDVKSEREARLGQMAAKADAYVKTLAAARASGKPDSTVFGILLGQKWTGIQDVNPCNLGTWSSDSPVPICTDPDGQGEAGKRWVTCAGISTAKFDTSWIISSVGVPKPSGNGLLDLLTGFTLASTALNQCKLDVGVTASGNVGLVRVTTSREAKDVATIKDQLSTKYGGAHTTAFDSWRGNGTSYKTVVQTWNFPALRVIYTEQVENNSGTAFKGGTLEISTAEWRTAVEAEKAKSRKPAL